MLEMEADIFVDPDLDITVNDTKVLKTVRETMNLP